MTLSLKAPAKLNLCLDTPFRHDSGEPEWKMVMTAVDLADYVHITPRTDDKIRVTASASFLPCDKRNLAFQAAILLQRLAHHPTGVDVVIDKKIPVAAGMGGGSADAAAVLRGLNELWQLNYSREQLAAIGLQIDSDVPYCLYNELALVSGKGEKIKPLATKLDAWIVIAKPPICVSTPSILAKIDYLNLTECHVNNVVAALIDHDNQKLYANMHNVLEPITAQRYPEVLRLKEKMLKFGAAAAAMTGTGPTVFGVCPKYSRAQHVYNSLRGFCKDVYLVHPL